MNEYSDEKLMSFLIEGKVQAFDELYNRYSSRLMGYFVRMLNYDRTLAEDAVQDLFLKIAEAPQKFDPQRSFKTWIFSIASNSCKNFYRHQIVKEKNAENIAQHNEQINETAFVDLASKMDAKEFRRLLDETLNQLPLEKKEAFVLKYQEEKSIAEIAAIQNCPEGSVKSRLFYTLKILQEKLIQFKPVL